MAEVNKIQIEVGPKIATEIMSAIHENIPERWRLVPQDQWHNDRLVAFDLKRLDVDQAVDLEIILKDDGTWSAVMAIDPTARKRE